MPLSFWMKVIVAGLIGGAVGAAGWAALIMGTGMEFGIFAWVVGILVGAAIAGVASSENTGVGTAAIAVVIALLSIAGGKLAAGWLYYEKAQTENIQLALKEDPDLREFAISYIADDIVDGRETANEAVDWPQGQRPDYPEYEEDYPADVWQEAEAQWSGMGEAERVEYVAANIEFLAMSRPEFAVRFAVSLGLLDIVFTVLAGATAFKLAGGLG